MLIREIPGYFFLICGPSAEICGDIPRRLLSASLGRNAPLNSIANCKLLP